jgi:succinylglutamate desuccinylase
MIKKKYLEINVQIFLKRKRLNNNIEIYRVLKKIEKMKNDYSNLEKIVNADIKKSNHNAFNKIKLLLNDISYYKYNNKTLFCFWFSQNLQNLKKKYLNKFKDYY